MGFTMNSRATYEGCLARADKARDVAWKKIMQYSGEMLYTVSQAHGGKTREWKVQTDTGEAFILPQLAILFYRVNVEWQKVFKHSLEVSGGYRTKSHQLREYRQARAEGRMAAEHSAHVSGVALDVVPARESYTKFSCGKEAGRNVLLGYLAWLFRRVARRGVNTFVHVEYAGNVTRQPEEAGTAWEWAGMKLLRPVPYTMVESANKALHVSYIWLLRAQENRKEELPSLVRPYSGDIANPEGTEAKGPRAFDPLLVSFDERTYLVHVGSGAKTTLGITSSWMKAFIEHEYPSEGEVIQVQEQIKSIEDTILQEKDSNKKNQLNNELDKLKKRLEELSQRRSDLSLVMDRDATLRALDEQLGWM
ncbi:hypothetical protein GH141_01380 [bacterium]|nr:hypothetical protein [bacterium]